MVPVCSADGLFSIAVHGLQVLAAARATVPVLVAAAPAMLRAGLAGHLAVGQCIPHALRLPDLRVRVPASHPVPEWVVAGLALARRVPEWAVLLVA